MSTQARIGKTIGVKDRRCAFEQNCGIDLQITLRICNCGSERNISERFNVVQCVSVPEQSAHLRSRNARNPEAVSVPLRSMKLLWCLCIIRCQVQQLLTVCGDAAPAASGSSPGQLQHSTWSSARAAPTPHEAGQSGDCEICAADARAPASAQHYAHSQSLAANGNRSIAVAMDVRSSTAQARLMHGAPSARYPRRRPKTGGGGFQCFQG